MKDFEQEKLKEIETVKIVNLREGGDINLYLPVKNTRV